MENNYILLFDELGQPYIAHSWLRKGEAPRYKLKRENYYGPGKHLYLYTDKEVAAFLKFEEKNQKNGTPDKKLGGIQKLKNSIRDKAGWDERSDYLTSKEKRDQAKKESDEAYTKYNRALHNQNTNMPAVNEANRKIASSGEAQNKLTAYNDAERAYREAEEAYSNTRMGQKELQKEKKQQEREEREREKKEAKQKKNEPSPYLSEEEQRALKNKRFIDNFLKKFILRDLRTTMTPDYSTPPEQTKPKNETPEEIERVRKQNSYNSAVKRLPIVEQEYSDAQEHYYDILENNGSNSKELDEAFDKVVEKFNQIRRLQNTINELKSDLK